MLVAIFIVLIIMNYTFSLRIGEKFISMYMKDVVYTDEIDSIEGVLLWGRLKATIIYFFVFEIGILILVYIFTGYFVEKNTETRTERYCLKIFEDYINDVNSEEKNKLSENFFLSEIKKIRMRYAIVDRYNKKYSLKDDVIANFAHDIKAPLTSIIGFLSLIENDEDISEKSKKKYIKTALEKSVELEKYLDDLFYIARYDFEHIAESKRKINLSIFLNQLVDEFYPNLLERSLSIKLDVDNRIFIIANLEEMSKVFGNIITNAIKYSVISSEIIINVTFKDILVIEFSNKTEHISEEDLSLIFNRFYRVDKSRDPNIGGAGLGLAIVKTIVENIKGEVFANYEKGLFKITIKIPGIAYIENVIS